MSEKEAISLIKAIQAGTYSINNLPPQLYNVIFSQLENSLIKGMNLEKIKKATPKKTLDVFLKASSNLRLFSACKTFQIVKDISALANVDAALNVFNRYTKTYQQVENDLAIKQGITVQDYFTFQNEKEDLPYLRYVTAEDERVRHAHAELHGIIRPVDDPFWNEFLPPLGFGCRCTTEQLESATSTTFLPNELKRYRQDIELKFRNNPANTGYIFKPEGKDKHPYFKVPEANQGAIQKLIKP